MVASTTFQDRPLLLAAALLTLLLRIVHCLHPDAMALLTFKSIMGATFLTSWDPATSHCSAWEGIHCDQDNRVSWFTLSPCWGQWPPTPTMQGSFDAATSLGDLTEVTPIDLSCNDFTGSLPSIFSKLTRLTLLRLRNNNHWEWSLPKDMLAMPKLEFLDLSSTNLRGDLPTEMPFWSPLLKHLDLSYNVLTGDIPSGFSLLSELQYLNLRANRIVYTETPNAILSMSRLTFLDISDNLFTGELSSELGLKVPSIMHLAAGNNQLTGSIPDSLTLLTALTSQKTRSSTELWQVTDYVDSMGRGVRLGEQKGDSSIASALSLSHLCSATPVSGMERKAREGARMRVWVGGLRLGEQDRDSSMPLPSLSPISVQPLLSVAGKERPEKGLK
ncbi:unnamed protein product [Closterium sp. NIES-65]|nr:unnamed protein product [Closterium sp. NIES-65]